MNPSNCVFVLSPEREKRTLRVYGLDAESFQQLACSQDGKCPICNHACATEDFVVDHCHSSGVVRGLLCIRCNAALGLLRDNPRAMRAAAEYVETRRPEEYK